jgi:hypothetical protein
MGKFEFLNKQSKLVMVRSIGLLILLLKSKKFGI